MPAKLTSRNEMPSSGAIGLTQWRDLDDSPLKWQDTVSGFFVYWEGPDFKEGFLYPMDDELEFGFLDTKKKRKKKKKDVVSQDVHDQFPDQNKKFHDENPE